MVQEVEEAPDALIAPIVEVPVAPARGGGRRQVRGPTSALTSFLRERGIVPPRQTRFQRIPVEEQFNPTQAAIQAQALIDSADPLNISNTSTLAVEDGVERAVAKQHSRKFPSKKKAESEEEDVVIVRKRVKKTSYAVDPKLADLVGFCVQCNRRFVVQDSVQGLCLACQNVTGKGGVSAAKKRALKKAQDLVLDTTGGYNGVILPLRDLCIKQIVDSIEMIGYIANCPSETKLKICKIISKQRKLDNKSLRLFLGPEEDQLNLFDCTSLDETGLLQIVEHSPHLFQLELGLCGRLTDTVLSRFEQLENLNLLKLSGPFLCSSKSFSSLFAKMENLSTLALEFAVKVTNETISTLTFHNINLTSLSLVDCPLIDNLDALSTLKHLSSLTLDSLGQLPDSSISTILTRLGPQLTHLSLNKHQKLTNISLATIKQFCTKLDSLCLEHCPNLDSEAMSAMLTSLPPLTRLELGGNRLLEDDVLESIYEHHAKRLTTLGINGLDLFSANSLFRSSAKLIHLVDLDVSWIRSIDDAFMSSLIANNLNLLLVKTFGCNQLSITTLNKIWLNKDGRRIRLAGNEFD